MSLENRQQIQSSSSETTLSNSNVQAVPVPQGKQPVIDPESNSVIQQLKSNTLEKVKTELNKITNQSKKNQQFKK